MTLKFLPASFVRGGTSNGLILNLKDLPSSDPTRWQPILASAMGSPDPSGRQLNGIGSGVSSTSKVCIVSKSTREDCDVEFTFVQVGIKDGKLDLAGNCGNMSSIVGPWAWNEGLLKVADQERKDENGKAERIAKVRILNTNTSKVIHAEFPITDEGAYNPFGDYAIDGVPGTGSRITLKFIDPAGAKTGKALPTGNPVDTMRLSDGTEIRASLVDVANPGVFVLASDLDLPGDIEPATLEADQNIMTRLEEIRQTGAKMMGMDPNAQTVPKIVLVSRPEVEAANSGIHIVCRALSMQQPHKAVPLTLALNLGAACRMSGTLPAMTAVNAEGRESLTIAHASGKLEVGSVFKDGQIESALLHRTARVLMKGDVFYSAPA
ncbi:3-methylitaconate isomerase [Cercospora zeina]